MENIVFHLDNWTYHEHRGQLLSLYGWFLTSYRDWECCFFADGDLVCKTPVRWYPRPDVKKNYPDRADTENCGFEIRLTGAWDLALSGKKELEAVFCRDKGTVQSAPRICCEVRETKDEQSMRGALSLRRKEPAPGLVTVKEQVTEQLRDQERVTVWKKDCSGLHDELAREMLLFTIDEFELSYHTMLTVRGWALSQKGEESLYVEDTKGSRIDASSVSRSVREDVYKALGLPETYKQRKIGFLISLDTTLVKERRLRVVCTDDFTEKVLEIDLDKAERESWKISRRKKVLSVHNRRENLQVIRERGLRGFAEYVDEQAGIIENEYERWRMQHRPGHLALRRQKKKVFRNMPVISIVTALYNTPLPFLRALIDSVQAQTYRRWQLCLADGSDNLIIRDYIHEHYAKEKRITYTKLTRNGGISDNTNEAIALAKGEFILFADHDDELEPDALFEIVSAINTHPDADAFYTDEDKMSMNGRHFTDPALKPDYNLYLLRDNNYICHIFVVRKKLLDQVGLLESIYDGAQDFDLILRCCEKAGAVVHIPMILYHWRCHLASTAQNPESKNYAYTSGAAAVEAHYRRMGIASRAEQARLTGRRLYGHYHSLIGIQGTPLVSIIIPTRDHEEDLRTCITSILEKTTWTAYEILVIDNGSREKAALGYLEELCAMDAPVRVLRRDEPFNYSKLNNFAAGQARGEYLCFLNNDTSVITDDWIQELLMLAALPDSGAVGAKLYYPDGRIQHAGVILGLGGVAGHIYSGCKGDTTGMMGRAVSVQELCAVTAACMMTRRSTFLEVGGFDEQFAVAYNDIDYCMRLRRAGYRVIFTPYAELTHWEMKSRGRENDPGRIRRFREEEALFQQRWQEELREGDPFYHPLLPLDNSRGELIPSDPAGEV